MVSWKYYDVCRRIILPQCAAIYLHISISTKPIISYSALPATDDRPRTRRSVPTSDSGPASTMPVRRLEPPHALTRCTDKETSTARRPAPLLLSELHGRLPPVFPEIESKISVIVTDRMECRFQQFIDWYARQAVVSKNEVGVRLKCQNGIRTFDSGHSVVMVR